MFKRLFALFTILALLGIALSGCTEPVPQREELEKTIKIGLILPMKGDYETYGMLSKNAIDLAIDEANAKGGILGHRLEVVPGDDASNPNVTSHVAQQLTGVQKVVAIVGPYTNQSAVMAAPVANKDGVPMLAIRASESNITSVGKYIFRACYVDTYQGILLGRFAGNDLKVKKVAVVYNNEDKDAKALIENFKQELKKQKIDDIKTVSYDSKMTDFGPLLEKIAGDQPDAILVTDFPDKAGLIIKQAREMGIKSTFLGTDFLGANIQGLISVAGDAAEGTCFSSHFTPEDPNKRVREFVELYEGDYGAKPGISSALSYDAVSLIIEAIKKAGSTDPDKIRNALAKINNFKGVSGTFSFDDNRNPIKGGVIMKVIKNGQAFEKRIEP